MTLLDTFEKRFADPMEEARQDMLKHANSPEGNKAALQRVRIILRDIKKEITGFCRATM